MQAKKSYKVSLKVLQNKINLKWPSNWLYL